MKARYLHQRHPGRGLTFATGTPISNTMAELYVVQKFLDPEGLQQRDIQVIEGANAARRAEDIGGQELSYAEVKAIASGNPAVLTLAEADAELQRLNILRKSHSDEQFIARRRLRELPQTIARLAQMLADLCTDAATVKEHVDGPVVIDGKPCLREEVLDVLGQRLNYVPDVVAHTRRFPLGVFRDLRFGLMVSPQSVPEVYLEGTATRQATPARDHRGPRAIMNALERSAGNYDHSCDAVRQDLRIAEGQFRDYQAKLGKAFPDDPYLNELIALRDQLRVGLSGAIPDSGADPQTSISLLAEQIKALKAAHAIEATPQRVGKGRSSIEER